MMHPNILCSVGKGEMTKQECLDCALRHENGCGYSYPLLKAIYSYDNARPDVHVTDVTGCLLRAYYGKKEPVTMTPHHRIKMALGSMTHARIEELEDEKYVAEKFIESVPFRLGMGGTPVGTVDCVLVDGTLIDFKTTRWMNIAKLPYGSHVEQVEIYAYLLKKQGIAVNKIQIQYIDFSGPTNCKQCRLTLEYDPTVNGLACPKCGFHNPKGHLGVYLYEVALPDYEAIEDNIMDRTLELRAKLEVNEPPAPEPSWLCNYCNFKQCPEHPLG